MMTIRTSRAALVLTMVLATSNGCVSLGSRESKVSAASDCRELSCQGVAAIESGQWEQAEVLLRQAVNASPVDAISRRHLADVVWRKGEREEAIRQIEAAVRLDPTDASLLVRNGEMLLATAAFEQALDRVNRAIGLDPRLAPAWALRGRIHWQLNEVDQAMCDLQRALQFSPGAADVLLDLAALHRQRGKHHRCLTTLHHLFDTYSPGEEPQFALLLEGLTLADLGRWNQAAESLAAASARGEPNVEILYHLARAELHAGHRLAAADAAQRALSIDKSHHASQELLAQLASSTPLTDAQIR
jgi:tetratricopeptide (TPR) repeat protein